MTATAKRSRTNGANGDGAPPVFDLEAPTTGVGATRWPEITVGLFIVAVFALAGTWFYAASTDKEAVIALGRDIERGEVIDTDDLAVVTIDSDDRLNVLGRLEAGLVVGRVALTDMAAGTLVTGDMFAPGSRIEPGSGVVGLSLGPGEYPVLSLRPGDTVRVVATPRPGADIDETADLVIVDGATVVDVGPIGIQNELFISLVMAAPDADRVAAAAAQDRVRLIQVAPLSAGDAADGEGAGS